MSDLALRPLVFNKTFTFISSAKNTCSDLGAEGGHSVIKVEPENCFTQTDDGVFMSVSERDETQTATQRDETPKIQSSWLHDNSSLSSEESSGQEEMSSSSETGKFLS